MDVRAVIPSVSDINVHGGMIAIAFLATGVPDPRSA
jgi:hypothetical protein